MTTPRLHPATIESDPDLRASIRDRVERSITDLRESVQALISAEETAHIARKPPPGRPRIVPRGLVLLTDDGQGVARAVAADLKALGHPVVRVRHGIAGPGVEGVNLTAATSVAALLDRVRVRGSLAAIVHASPLRADPEPGHVSSWDDPDDARALALLAQAGADDLKASATRGGACLVVARRAPVEGARAPDDRLARWVEISARTLGGVRVRGLELDREHEPEVLAAEVVREVLGTAVTPPDEGMEGIEPGAIPAESEAILLAAPDRAAWIHLAAALIDWLDDAPSVRLADLAFTLHDDQPAFPFRVGLVANSGPDLAERLRLVIGRLAESSCRSIQDLSGAYWSGGADATAIRPRRSRSWVHRFRRVAGAEDPAPPSEEFPVEALVSWSGRDWLNHLAASRFASGEPIRAGLLIGGRAVRKLDLSAPPMHGDDFGGDLEVPTDEPSEADRLLRGALEALDPVLALQKQILVRLLAEGEGPGR